MTVTIITPSYMHGAYLADCLESVRSQSYREIRHIIVDGGSRDETTEIVKGYIGTYNVEFVCEDDGGPADAINKALDMSDGDIVCWLNADDMFFNGKTIERVVQLFHDNPSVDVITGDGYYITQDGVLLRPIKPVSPRHISLQYMRYADYMLQPSTFWRRNDLRLSTDLNYTFDWDLFLTMFENGMNVMYVPEYFSCYRLHRKSLTFQDTAARKLEIFLLVKKRNGSLLLRAWCRLVYLVYLLAERVGVPGLKRIVQIMNEFIKRMTDYRIGSS